MNGLNEDYTALFSAFTLSILSLARDAHTA